MHVRAGREDATLVLRFWRGHLVGGVSIPQNLLLMTGLSVLTFAGAKGRISPSRLSVTSEVTLRRGESHAPSSP
ncbi:MAG: hypothetical protein QOF89_5370 [Acidobacteriota bacterium]|jgi:hypothetical protein|nr:hypothetical protein [Acidobacteriota bacterium]